MTKGAYQDMNENTTMLGTWSVAMKHTAVTFVSLIILNINDRPFKSSCCIEVNNAKCISFIPYYT